MPQAGVYVFASLVSAALILASGPSYTQARSPQGTSHNVKRGQSAYNECQASSCQIAYLNSVEDFCLWAPSQPEPDLSATRKPQHTLTAWCTKSTHGTQLILDGTISQARFVKTPEYIQITGVGNLTNINAPADGVASASGEGGRGPGLVFTSAYGQLEQIYDWTSFVSQERFCFRACNPSAAASTACPRFYVSGCTENVPGNHDAGVFEDCIGDAMEAASTLYQEVLAAPWHYSAHPPSGCTTHGTIGNERFTRARRAISSTSGSASSAPVTLFSRSHFRPHRQNTPLTSSIATTSTDTATTIIFPPFPTPSLNTTTSMNSTTPVSPPTPTSTPYSFNRTHAHSQGHSHLYSHSRHHFSTSSASVSSSSSSSSSPHSFSSQQSSSSIGLSLSDPSSTSPASSPTSFTLTSSTSSSSNLSSLGTSTSCVTCTTPASTSSFPSSSYGTSSSLSEPCQLSSCPSSPASSPASPTLSTTPLSMSSSPSSQSSVILTFTTSHSPSSAPTTPLSMSSSTSSQSSVIFTFTTSHSPSSAPTTSPATSSSAFPNSPTQLSSQCSPLLQVAVNAGSITPSTPLPLICTLLMIVILSSIGVFIF